MTIKLLDSAFHHHGHFVCTAKNTKQLHEFHSKCPVQSFVLSVFFLQKIPQIDREISFYETIINDISVHYFRISRYSFLLRAPPLNITC